MGEWQSAEASADPGPDTLTIEVGGATHTVRRTDGAVTIGREPPAQILLRESGISRAHLRIQYDQDHWSVIDTASRNGTYVNGVRVEHLAVTAPVTVRLGDPNGIAVHLDPRPPLDDAPPAEATVPVEAEDDVHPLGATSENDAISRLGGAVEERREELGLSVSTLIAGVMTHEDYALFTGGQLSPGDDVRRVLEQRLVWPEDTVHRVLEGAEVPEEELTDLLSPTVQVAVALDAAEVEVRTIRHKVNELPDPRDERFARTVTPLLTQLRRLDHLGTSAARTAPGRPEVLAALAAIREARAEVVLYAGRSPGASLGQRLGAVRVRGRLSVAEIATAAGVTTADVESVEREDPASVAVLDALERFVAAVGTHLRVLD
ncbi:FHA domain-containing protein [Mycolicibacterium frederiksbergense]|nr:FHA domain-containing protein [Mycolicibacterium frederiksbergense]